jgi:serine/threonine-protein kinase
MFAQKEGLLFRFLIPIAGVCLAVLAPLSAACGGDDDDGGEPAAASALDRLPAAGNAPPAGSRVFVGHDDANRSSVGLTIFEDGVAVAYVCDGDKTWAWYEGKATGNDVSLSSSSGDKLTATVTGSSVSGRAGQLAFKLDAASSPGGLFRSLLTNPKGSATVGWVVENDGTTRGGFNGSGSGKTTSLGGSFTQQELATIQGLPEFPEIKAAAPRFPEIGGGAEFATFRKPGGVCAKIGLKLLEQAPPGPGPILVPDTQANRARLGLLGRLGCDQAHLGFVIA